jgi:site-specific DNA recombinase
MKPFKTIRCAIYTRVSTDQGLDQKFNSLDAQREAAEAYIKSQAHEGWICLKQAYDDGGYSAVAPWKDLPCRPYCTMSGRKS